MSEVAIPDEVMVPWSGEVIRTADIPTVALRFREAQELTNQVIAFRDGLRQLILSHMDSRAEYKIDLNGVTVKGDKPAMESNYDVTELVKLLSADPPLPEDRYNELVKAKVEYVVYEREAKVIAAANPAWAEIIERAKRPTPKRRYVRF